ncbi:nucleotidyl transferase AbiEii/AbiGii toxin family protein [Patescibacteria group bacterium]|nr:nucleotidyl transferase AbiEii/AbiGii toxin family protein [Patescibacteria group bacterium]
MDIKYLQEIVDDKKREGLPKQVIINYLKEALQFPILSFIYKNDKYKNFVFTGGSCLRICYGAPRLSEDLDFDLIESDWDSVDLDVFGEEVVLDLSKKYLLPVKYKRQSNCRLYLKFSILKQLGLAEGQESDFLFVKVESSKMNYKNPELEVTPISNYGYNFLVKNYSLPYLMVGKIGALFQRMWFKGSDNEIDVKGRDFYDLFWYLKNNIEPAWDEMQTRLNISNYKELKEKIIKLIDEKVTTKKLSYDLKNFFSDQSFVEDFCENYKQIILKYL